MVNFVLVFQILFYITPYFALLRGGGSLEWETQNEYKILVMNPEVKNVSVTPGRTSADVI